MLFRSDHVFIISKGKLVASDATENLINLMSKNQEINLVLKSDAVSYTHLGSFILI